MKKINISLLLSTLLLTQIHATKPQLPEILNPETNQTSNTVPTTFKRTGPTVQIGLLLDTSGSMNGLIDQAKDQLWKIVNEVAKANKDNKDVVIEVGLFEYGKSSLASYEGYLQMLSPLTSDLDEVSDALFKLQINGSEEYAGKVILASVNRFVWSDHKDDLKLLIIAGNEPFTQGDVPYAAAIKKAKDNHILVNTIYCGDMEQGVQERWADGAKLGGGKYFNINHNDKRVYVPSPYDDKIIALGTKLNATYISYGSRSLRESKIRNRQQQDTNSKRYSKSSYIERNLMKSKKQYSTASLDMVSAYMDNPNTVEKISEENLPDALKGKSKVEIEKVLESKKVERVALQKEIRALEVKRDTYIAEKTTSTDKDLGSAIITSIRKQATENGFIFKK